MALPTRLSTTHHASGAGRSSERRDFARDDASRLRPLMLTRRLDADDLTAARWLDESPIEAAARSPPDFGLPRLRPECGTASVHAEARDMARESKNGDDGKLGRKRYEKELGKMQVELCRLQDWVKHTGARVILVFEG